MSSISVENGHDGLIDERCECGNLLCKVYSETVEIKCRRCKRIHVIPIDKLMEYRKALI